MVEANTRNLTDTMSQTPSRAWPWWLSGTLSLVLIALLTVLPMAVMLIEAGSINWSATTSNVFNQRVVIFSFVQASLSTLLALGLALPVALALAHTQHFAGRSLIITLFSLSLVIPTVVAIYGIVAVFGKAGWLSALLAQFGLDPIKLYGLQGILIAHVFFNMPLAARVLLMTLESISQNQWRLAQQLGMRPLSIWRYIEWPAIRGQLPGLALLIFTLCFTSFAIVMTLGGGPRATTIEVAVFQALRFDFDISTAVALALVQLGICLALALLSTLFKAETGLGFETLLKHSQNGRKLSDKTLTTPWSGASHVAVNLIVISIASIFVLAPLLALVLAGFNDKTLWVLRDPQTLRAILNTGAAALAAATLAITLGLGLLFSARHLRVRLNHERSGYGLQLAGNVILILPPIVLGTGLFLLLRPYADVFSIGLLLVILINSLMALPFVIRILENPVVQTARKHDALVHSLGIHGLSRWRFIDWPQLRSPLALAFAVSATLSAGDLSAIALFGSERVTTLPLLLYQRMGSHRLEEAAVTASLLLLLCLALFVFLQWLIKEKKHAKA